MVNGQQVDSRTLTLGPHESQHMTVKVNVPASDRFDASIGPASWSVNTDQSSFYGGDGGFTTSPDQQGPDAVEGDSGETTNEDSRDVLDGSGGDSGSDSSGDSGSDSSGSDGGDSGGDPQGSSGGNGADSVVDTITNPFAGFGGGNDTGGGSDSGSGSSGPPVEMVALAALAGAAILHRRAN
ncbi:hypothetical protein ACFQL4_02280 [Halosimplex aquaticum]